MRPHQHVAPLVVVRSEAESGRVGLRLIGELDLNTVDLLEAELAGSRDHSPPAVIDLSELRFLDLVGLRALLRAGEKHGAPSTRLVGATGIVRRLINLTRALDAETAAAAGSSFTRERKARRTTTSSEVVTNGNGNGNGTANGNGNGNGHSAANGNGNGHSAANGNGNGRRAAPTRNRKAG